MAWNLQSGSCYPQFGHFSVLKEVQDPNHTRIPVAVFERNHFLLLLILRQIRQYWPKFRVTRPLSAHIERLLDCCLWNRDGVAYDPKAGNHHKKRASPQHSLHGILMDVVLHHRLLFLGISLLIFSRPQIRKAWSI